MNVELDTILEDAVAISDEFHNNRDLYQKFYDRHASELGGFPGIWAFVVEAVKLFHETYSNQKDLEWGVTHDYLETVAWFGGELVKLEDLAGLGPKMVEVALHKGKI